MTLYTIFVDPTLSTKTGYIVLVATCFFVACFWSWRELHRQIETEQQKEAKRQSINALIQKGNAIVRENIYESPGVPPAFGPAPPRSEDIAKVDEWIKEAEEFIGKNHPTFLGQFHNESGFPPHTISGKPLFDRLLAKMSPRLARLGELLVQI